MGWRILPIAPIFKTVASRYSFLHTITGCCLTQLFSAIV